MLKKNILLFGLSALLVISGIAPFVAADAAVKVSMKKNQTIFVGQKKKLALKVTSAKRKLKAKWKSKKPKVASVNKKGVVKGKSTGKTVITAKVTIKERKYTAKCILKVKNNMIINDKTDIGVVVSNTTAKPSEATIKPSEQPSEKPQNPINTDNTGIDIADKKPRTIITQDGECDDSNSLIHNILFSDEIGIEGIILSSSCWHWQGGKKPDGSIESACRWAGSDWMFDMIDAYEEVYPNLIVHSPNYPTPDYLRSITKVGNVAYEGEMDGSTEGSNLIKERILADEPGPLFLEAWGGTNTIAVALRDIEDEYIDTPEWDDIYNEIGRKVIITACGKQDDTYDNYIAKAWPNIPFVGAEDQTAYGYCTKGHGSEEMKRTMSSDWIYENIDQNHGALMDLYVVWGDGTELPYEIEGAQFGTNDSLLHQSNWMSSTGYDRYDFLSEGDSPTFFGFFDTGLRFNSIEEFTYGGYAGRYKRKPATETEPNHYQLQNDNDHVLGLNGSNISLMKWVPDIQHNFAVRADWCITPEYKDANHRPDIAIKEGTSIAAKPGEKVTLNAVTSDPDGDNVYVSWWNYVEAGTYKTNNPIEIVGNDTNTATFTIPSDAEAGDTIHIIARAEDDGEHNLAYHQRIIIEVEGK